MDAFSFFQQRITFGQFYILVYFAVLAFESSLGRCCILAAVDPSLVEESGILNKAKGAFDSFLVSLVITLIYLRLTHLSWEKAGNFE